MIICVMSVDEEYDAGRRIPAAPAASEEWPSWRWKVEVEVILLWCWVEDEVMFFGDVAVTEDGLSRPLLPSLACGMPSM